MTIRPRITALATLAACALIAASAALAETATFEKTVPLAAGGRVSLENVNGSVAVGVWDRAEVKIAAVRTADSQACLDDLRIDVDASPSAVRITTHYPSSGLFGFSHCSAKVEYTLTVPASARLDEISLVNSSLEIAGVTGGVRGETVNGRIRATGLAGGARLSTVNGSLEVAIGQLAAGDAVELESVNGRIELTLPASTAARINAKSVNGAISNDFGLEAEKHRGHGHELHGRVGDGGGSVELSTVNGRITIRKL